MVDGARRGQHLVVADDRVRVDLARHDQRVVVAVAARELLDALRAVHAVLAARVIRRVVERGAAEAVVAVADDRQVLTIYSGIAIAVCGSGAGAIRFARWEVRCFVEGVFVDEC